MHCRWCCNRDKQPSLVTATSSTSSSFFSTFPVTNPASSTGSAAAPVQTSKAVELQERLLVTLLTVVFYYYPSLMTTALSLFQCYRIDPVSAQAGQNYPQNAKVWSCACSGTVSFPYAFLVLRSCKHHDSLGFAVAHLLPAAKISCCNKLAHQYQSQQQFWFSCNCCWLACITLLCLP